MVESKDFEAIRKRARELGDRLADDQLLDLADVFHDLLRERRGLRARSGRGVGETRSFLPN